MVQPTRGPSLNTNPAKVDRFGGAYRVDRLPDGLQIIQRGKDLGHHGNSSQRADAAGEIRGAIKTG